MKDVIIISSEDISGPLGLDVASSTLLLICCEISLVQHCISCNPLTTDTRLIILSGMTDGQKGFS